MSRSGSFRSQRAACNAGASPKITGVNTANASVKANTWAFSPITDSAGIESGGIVATMNFSPPHAAKAPSAAPPIASTRLSASRSRISLAWPAPSTARRANSFSRAVARASIKFATFTQAISSSNPTAVKTVYNVDSRCSPPE